MTNACLRTGWPARGRVGRASLLTTRALFKLRRRARASVATQTEAAPAFTSACAAARAVAPVVKMSSTQQNVFAANRCWIGNLNAPRTFSRRWRGVSPAWLSVARSRISVLGASVRCQCGMRFAQRVDGLCGQSPRLVESALSVLCCDAAAREPPASRGRLGRQLRDGCASIAPARARRDAAVVFERVDGLAHAALVGADKRRPAQTAAGPGGRRGKALSSAKPSIAGAIERIAAATHTTPSRTGISVQQTSQIGTEEKRGRGEPQREQEAGRRAQPTASRGLRSTRATARHREVSDGGTSNVSEPESLRKTHLTWAARTMRKCRACVTYIYSLFTYLLASQVPDSAPRKDMFFTGLHSRLKHLKMATC